ncbi:MAG TPA: anti-sigma factor [Solirubrobacteraceae bacterium]|nr:anti-sigma factor [Solirubrobacteraceae bacterium]
MSDHSAREMCGDAPLYLLGLLDDDAAERFRVHAAHCSICADELASLAPAVDRLAAGVPQRPVPQEIKRAVMAEVRADARERSQGARASRRSARRTAPAFAAAAAVAALAVLAVLLAGGGNSTRTLTGRVTVRGATAVVHEHGGTAWLSLTGMPAPAPGHVYEVWVTYPGRRLPAPTTSLFSPTSHGVATVAVQHGSGARAVLVTEEPDGGTTRPTAAPVVDAPLS